MSGMEDRSNSPIMPPAAIAGLGPEERPPSRLDRWRAAAWDRTPPALQQRWIAFMEWVERKVPPGLRLPLGILLMIGGLLAFLPVFAVWMFPLGIAVAALDVRPMRERWRERQARRALRAAHPDEEGPRQP